jgi:hypothetical protein
VIHTYSEVSGRISLKKQGYRPAELGNRQKKIMKEGL